MSTLSRRASFNNGLLIKEGPGVLPISPLSDPSSSSHSVPTVGAGTLTAAILTTGLIVRTGATAVENDTTDTGANIDAAFLEVAANANNNAFTQALYDIGIGESFEVKYSNQVAYVMTIVGGTGVTITSTKNTVAASGVGTLIFTKTGAGTYNLFIL